jgi:hypothetical protein
MPAQSNGSAKNGGAAAPLPVIPFTRASVRHTEQFLDVNTAVLSAASQPFGPFDVPAYGYMRSLYLIVTTNVAGSGGSATLSEDGPWNLFQSIQLSDTNGAPIFGPVSGYDLYLANKYGGYDFSADPKQSPSFSAVNATTGAFAFALRIPIELVARDALGALANQNGSSTYKLSFIINPSTVIYATPPATTLPSMKVQAVLEAWALPTQQDLRGLPQETMPMAHGTTQYWTKYTANALNGQQTVRFTRMGNQIRNLILVCRRNASTRANGETDFPVNSTLSWDTRLVYGWPKVMWRDYIKQITGYFGANEAAGAADNGVFLYNFANEFNGKVGSELRESLLPTLQSTRLEFNGVFGNTNNVDVITNDVAAAGEIVG